MGAETEVGEIEQLIGSGQNSIALFFQLGVGGGRHDNHVDDALHQRGHARGVGTESQNFDFLFAIDASLFDHHAGGDIGSGAETADAEGFAFEVFERLDLRLGDQRHRPVVEKSGDDSHWQAGNRAADDGAEELAVVNVAGGQRRDRDVGIHADDLGVEIFILEEPALQRHLRGEIGHVGIRHRDANALSGVASGAEAEAGRNRDD